MQHKISYWVMMVLATALLLSFAPHARAQQAQAPVIVAQSQQPPEQASGQQTGQQAESGKETKKEKKEKAKEAKAKEEAAPASRVGAGFRISTLGLGGEAAVRLADRANVRGGFNAFFYNRGYDNNGIHYVGDLKWESGEVHLDFYPLGHTFHISPGLIFYNNNHVTATANVNAGNTFTLNGTTYESDPADPITGTGNLSFRKAAPTLMIGFGNLAPKKHSHFSFNIEAGIAFSGAPQIALNLTGSVCDTSGLNCRSVASDPTVQSNVTAEQGKISNDLSPFKYYPLAAMTFGVHF
jgi:hypothetical protein